METSEPVAKPVQRRDPVRTKRRILRSAIALFAKQGLNGTSVDEIAHRAQCNKRMIYHYYHSKDELYLTVIQEVYGRIRTFSTEGISDPDSLTCVLDHLVEEYFHFLQENPEFVSLLNWENSQGAQGMRKVDMPSFVEPVVAVIRRALKNARETVDDVEIAHMLITIVGLCGYYFSNRHTLSAGLGLDLSDPAHLKRWQDHVKRIIHEGMILDPNHHQG